MKKKLGILTIVDETGFLDEMSRELQRAGLSFEVKRAESKEQFIHELMCHRPEVILSNQGLPCFSGPMAHATAREKCPDVPFIYVKAPAPKGVDPTTLTPGAAAHAVSCTLATLGHTVRRTVREARMQARLRVRALQVLTSRWLARS